MIKDLFLKELYLKLSDKTIQLSYVIIIALFIISGVAYNFSSRYIQQVFNKEELNNELLMENNANELKNLFFVDQTLAIPNSVVTLIWNPFLKNIPNSVTLNYFREKEIKSLSGSNDYISGYLSLDWTTIIVYVISFVCLCASYSSISGEKLNGTLKLMLVYPVHRWKILISKFLAILTSIMLPLLIGMLICLLIVLQNVTLTFSASDLVFFGIFLLGTLLFVSFNVLVGMCLSALTSHPSKSLMFSLLVWVIGCIVLSDTTWIISQKLNPIKSQSQLKEDEGQMKRSLSISPGGYNYEYGADHPVIQNRHECMNEYDRIHNTLISEYRNSLFNQTNSAIKLSNISPYTTFVVFAEKLVPGSFTSFVDLYKQAQVYRNQLATFLDHRERQDKNSAHLVWNEKDFASRFMSNAPVNYEEIPKFKYRYNFAADNSLLIDLTIIVLWNIVLFLITFFAYIKYDPR